MSEEQDPALIDMPVRQHKNVRRLEVNLRLLIWNELRLEQVLAPLTSSSELFPDWRPVFLAVLGLPAMISR